MHTSMLVLWFVRKCGSAMRHLLCYYDLVCVRSRLPLFICVCASVSRYVCAPVCRGMCVRQCVAVCVRDSVSRSVCAPVCLGMCDRLCVLVHFSVLTHIAE
jgi:hypothetical protein